jgi:BirA family biotin operon repressor/biotin-[acetyl-CoA-carboxylase] ligase
MQYSTSPTVWHLPSHVIGRTVLHFASLDSTSNYAAALGEDHTNDGTVVLADDQTAGRGQQGRSWLCPPGSGVLMSVLLFPPAGLRRPALLTAWAAVAVVETILEMTGLQAQIKWPNDVLIRGRKTCGILIESRPTAGPNMTVVAGIGLNVNQPAEVFEGAELPTATSLAIMAGRTLVTADVARCLIRHLDDGYERLRTGDHHTLEAAWKAGFELVGRRVIVECHDRMVRGRLFDMRWNGIELELEDGSRRVLMPESVRHIKSEPGTIPEAT